MEWDNGIPEEDGLPDHKKTGWAERMYEQADLRRKEQKETPQEKGNNDDH